MSWQVDDVPAWLIDEVGKTLVRSGYRPEAAVVYKALLVNKRKRSARDPTDVQAQRDLSVSLNKIGTLLLRAGDTGSASDAFNEALTISRAFGQVATNRQ